jgi:hypothetical protein
MRQANGNECTNAIALKGLNNSTLSGLHFRYATVRGLVPTVIEI